MLWVAVVCMTNVAYEQRTMIVRCLWKLWRPLVVSVCVFVYLCVFMCVVYCVCAVFVFVCVCACVVYCVCASVCVCLCVCPSNFGCDKCQVEQ